ncbi:MAG TPA: CpaF family protein [Acidimicrobiales bacterium]|nr:CpaF family protein [Acidimicrobiales bacterium]
MTLSDHLRKAGSFLTTEEARSRLLEEVHLRVHQRLIEELGPELSQGRLTAKDLRPRVNAHLQAALADESTPLSLADKARLGEDIANDILGYGPIQAYLEDPEVSEVMVNGPDRIYIERHGKIQQASATFIDEAHLRRVIDKIVGEVSRRVDEASPMVDARLPDGSRVNAVIHPLAIGGPFLTIRKFSKDPLQVEDLITNMTLTPALARFIEACVVGRLNIIVSGGTDAGKTTLLNVLSSFVPTDERIVTIEDSKELQLRQEHVASLEARPPNIEGRGEITIRDLVRNSLRMRPDRIIVGECRSGEALDMLQAMNTGHDGSLTTIHSNGPRDTLSRIETMTLMAGFDLPIRVIREQMSSAIDLVVHLSRLRDGTRRVTHVSEVQHMEGDVIIMQDLFMFDFSAGMDEQGRYKGTLKSLGIRPHFADKLEDAGMKLDPELFQAEEFARVRVARR